jgi:hypothetical protein
VTRLADMTKLADWRIPARKLERPDKVRRRRQEFIMVPLTWLDRLGGARGQTVIVALHLLHLAWRNRGEASKRCAWAGGYEPLRQEESPDRVGAARPD